MCMLNNLDLTAFSIWMFIAIEQARVTYICTCRENFIYFCVSMSQNIHRKENTVEKSWYLLQLKKNNPRNFQLTRKLTSSHSTRGYFSYHHVTEDVGRGWVMESADKWKIFWCDFVTDMQVMTCELYHMYNALANWDTQNRNCIIISF